MIKWASQASTAPWHFAVVIEEVAEIAKNMNISYHLIKRCANSEADRLAKEGVPYCYLLLICFWDFG